MSYNTRDALDGYKQGIRSEVETASPHRLIQMLMQGALEKIAIAKGFMQQQGVQAIAAKGEQITWAISIIDGLKVSLDKSTGGDIADNLESLYVYMIKRLMEANLHNKIEYLDEVAGLLKEIKSSWDAIPRDIIEEHAQKKARENSKDSAA